MGTTPLPDDVVEAAGRDLAHFAVSFMKLVVRGGNEDGLAAGSGSLVKIGSAYGVLTAAHVLENLPNEPVIDENGVLLEASNLRDLMLSGWPPESAESALDLIENLLP